SVEAAAAEPAEAATAETPAAEAAAAPAEPEFDEIWFPAGRRPDNPRHQNRHHRGAPQQNGEGQPAEANGERPQRNFRRPDRDGDKPGQGKRPPRPEGDRRDGGKPFENRGGKPAG